MSLINSLNQTNLDIQSKDPLGGPNRTNSANIPNGDYLNKKATNQYNLPPGFTPTILMDPNQSFSFQNNDKIQLNRYLPDDVPGGNGIRPK
jgi:hypothetical protein